jgi:hypothetical protein
MSKERRISLRNWVNRHHLSKKRYKLELDVLYCFMTVLSIEGSGYQSDALVLFAEAYQMLCMTL